MPSRRRILWVLLALGLGSLLFFWPLGAGRHLLPFHVFAGDPALEGLDLTADRPDWRFFDTSPLTLFYAQKVEAARAFREGELPLWNPYASLGAPLLANGQSQPFAPFFLPFLLEPDPRVYSACILLQLLFAGWGAARWLGRFGAAPWVQGLAAALFAFNPYALNYCVYSDVWAYAWFPWVFEAAEAWVRQEGRWRRIPVLLAFMALSGHLEEAFFGAAGAFAYLAVRLAQERALWAAWGRWAAIPVTAAGLSALWLLPFLEYLAHVTSPRFGGNVPYPYPPSAPFVVGGELLWPPLLMGLAVAGAAAGRSLRWALLPSALWAAAMMFPAPQWLQRAVTFDFMSGRYGRSLAWFVLATAAALGLHALAEEPAARLRWTAAVAGTAWLVLGLAASPPTPALAEALHWVPLSGPTPAQSPGFVVLSAAGLLLLALPSWVLSSSLRAGLLALPLLTSTLLYHAAFDVYWNRSEPRPAPEVRRAAADGRLWFGHAGKWKSFPPNLATAFAVRDVRLCDPFVPKRLEALRWPRKDHQDLFEAWDEGRARFVGVAEALDLLPGPGGIPRLLPRQVEGSRSRAFLSPRAIRAGSRREALREAMRLESLSDRVFLEGTDVEERVPGASRSPGTATVHLIQETAGTQRWRVETPEGGWLVVRDLHWPGWKARVEGKAAPILPADGLFRAVALPPGRHEVEFRYRPASFLVGALLSALTALGLFFPRGRRP